MKLINRKTRKVLRKNINKAIKKHGPAIAAGLVGGIASTLAAFASTEAPDDKHGQSRLGQLTDKVQGVFAPERKGKPGHNGERKAARRAARSSLRTRAPLRADSAPSI